ncbi:MAG: hypothetical protein KA118_17025, partial [Verrucomicrobia bacterium]|nr:hypothetical protein [Verrucomicrobiota bacterium]
IHHRLAPDCESLRKTVGGTISGGNIVSSQGYSMARGAQGRPRAGGRGRIRMAGSLRPGG